MSIKKVATQVISIIAAAVLLGLTANFMNPNGVKITINRSAGQASDDALFQHGADREMNEPIVINKEQLKKLLAAGDIIIIDTRSPQEFLHGRIPHAINIPFEMLDQAIATIDSMEKTSWIVTYCDGPPCDKAQHLGAMLSDMGFTRVAFYDAGLDDWKITEDIEE
ncbi:rhodanese-like domain-containing protein [candidate division KSB1 bacterium]|nr:rhodanese-like domain-containing protein [candidate division KSB1 bacterium]